MNLQSSFTYDNFGRRTSRTLQMDNPPRFCEKNFTEFLARLEKMVSVFLSSPRHSEWHFKLKTSEFRCEMNF